MIYLTKNEIVLINTKTVNRHGGSFIPPSNFHNEEALDYLVEAVESMMFGKPLYPELYQKVGLYMFNIINNHVFQDGNKRTGLEVALLFIKLNGFKLFKGFFKDYKGELIEFTTAVAAAEYDLEGVQEWFKERMIRSKPRFNFLLSL